MFPDDYKFILSESCLNYSYFARQRWGSGGKSIYFELDTVLNQTDVYLFSRVLVLTSWIQPMCSNNPIIGKHKHPSTQTMEIGIPRILQDW